MHSLPGQPKHQREGLVHGFYVSKSNAAPEVQESGRFLKKAAQKLP
jgi:hypothetical protein